MVSRFESCPVGGEAKNERKIFFVIMQVNILAL